MPSFRDPDGIIFWAHLKKWYLRQTVRMRSGYQLHHSAQVLNIRPAAKQKQTLMLLLHNGINIQQTIVNIK